MLSISPAFTRAAGDGQPIFNSASFWMLVWAIAIDDDRQRREKERRRKRALARKAARKAARPKRPLGPRPF